MRVCAVLAALAAGLGPAALAAPAAAEQRQIFEKVKGWEIERTVGDTSANPCIMTYSYLDKDDDNAENAVVFGLDGSNAILVLGYENWEWDKDEKVKVPFVIGRKVADAKSRWIGDGKLLRGKFPDTIVPDLLSAKTIELRIKDAEAEFDIPGFPQAYESLRRCDIASAKTADANPVEARPVEAKPVESGRPDAAKPVETKSADAKPAEVKPVTAPAAAEPSEAKARVYVLALMLQQIVNECDLATTAQQRNAVEAKLAALHREMAAFDAELREQVKTRPAPHCPLPQNEPNFRKALQDFIEMTPEDFAAAVAKRVAREEAAGAQSGVTGPGAKP